jgi:uncharacterized protein YvpB
VKIILSLLVLITIFFSTPFITSRPAYAQEQETTLAVPAYVQQRNLSCEVAASRMVLSFYGHDIDEAALQASLPLNQNPNLGFRGNVDGRIGFDNYGVHAEPIANLLDQNGLPATAYYGIDENFIRQKLSEGKPVIIWGTARLKGRGKAKYDEIDGQQVKVVLGEHTFVVAGYDNGKFIINDSIGGRVYKVRSLTSLGWNSLDRMAVVPD